MLINSVFNHRFIWFLVSVLLRFHLKEDKCGFLRTLAFFFNAQNRVVRDTLGETRSPETLAPNQTRELKRSDSAATTTDSCCDSVRLKKLDAAVYRNDLLNDDDHSGPFLFAIFVKPLPHFSVLSESYSSVN